MEIAKAKKKPLGEFDEDELGEPKAKQETDTPNVKIRRAKIGSPAFLPEAERLHYDKIQNLHKRFLRQLMTRWNKFKKDYLNSFEKQVSRTQRQIFKTMLDDFSGIAEDGFAAGVSAGNGYFEDQFSVNGLSGAQQRRIVRQHRGVFNSRANVLFFEDVVDQVSEAPPEEREDKLSLFDKFLFGYANVAGALAYSVFSKNIEVLNVDLKKLFSAAGDLFSKDIVKMEWKLMDDSEHSSDCLFLAEGEEQKGDGIWDARTLSEMGLVPKSPNLDCGGKCNCHLSPVVPTPEDKAKWLDKVTIAPRIKDALTVSTNATQARMLALFRTKNFSIPGRLADDIIRRPSFRRTQFFSRLPQGGIKYRFTTGTEFSVTGQTTFTSRQAVKEIIIDITLPPGQTASTITARQADAITRTLAHELGHTFGSIAGKLDTGKVFGIHGLRGGEELLKIAERERRKALSQIQNNFKKILRNIPRNRRAQLGGVVDTIEDFLKNPDDFLDDLFDKLSKGETFGGVPAEQAYETLNKAITEFATGTQLVRSYQLWDRSEYLADWFAVLLTDPNRAAALSPNLNKAMASRYTSFFKKTTTNAAQQVIPDSVAATFRGDLPLDSAFLPIAPNLQSIGSAAVKFRTATKRVSNSTVQRQVASALKSSPNLHRQEFFRGLKVRFQDKLQVQRATGSRRNLAYFDKGQFVVNYDRWRGMTDSSRSAIMADVVSRHVWTSSKSSVRKQIRDQYAEYLDRTFDVLANKANVQNLARRPIEAVKDVVLGNKEFGIPRNLGFWGRNFESIRPVVRNVTDLPIINVDSLASPQAYWSEWFRLYVTKPGAAQFQSPELKEILNGFLRTSGIGKLLDFMKERI